MNYELELNQQQLMLVQDTLNNILEQEIVSQHFKIVAKQILTKINEIK